MYFGVGDVGFLNSENYGLYKASKIASLKIQANFNIDQNKQIEYVGKLSLGRFLYKGMVDFNTITFNPTLADDTKNTDHRITYTAKINTNSALQLTTRYIYDSKPQDYLFDDFIYQDLFPSNDSIQSIAAKSHIKTSLVGFESTLFSKGASSNLEIRTGYSLQGSELISSLRLNAPMAQMDAGTAYQNDFKFELGDVYVKSNYRQYFGAVSLGISLDAHQYFATDVRYQRVNDTPFNLIPGLGFSWQINKDNKIIVSYKYGLKNTNLEDIYDGYILSNYRFFQKGLGSFQQFRGNFFLASYFLGDWQDSFLLNGTMIYNKDNAYLGSNTVIRQNYVQSTPILLVGKEFFSMNLSVDRFIEALSTNLKLKGNYTDNYYQNMVNSSSLRDITFRTYDYGL
ncbi:MAG: hypothetical protein MUO53_11705 [Maribacter sp.]|nr:hypothetical protein [Maribacter sp.]